MRIAIIGAGAMGSLLAAKLSPLGDVRLVSSWADQVREVRASGLRITNLGGNKTTIPVRITIDPVDAGPVDLAIICVKSHQTDAAAEKAARLLKPSGLALTLQNGLGNADRLAAVLGAARVVQGVTSHGATMLEPGHVRHAGSGLTWFETRPAIAERVAAIKALFEQAGFETHIAGNLDSVVWGKLVINAGINALTAILRVPNGVLAQTQPAERVMLAAVAEAVAVARAKGIALPYDDSAAQVNRVALATAANRSSMLADVARSMPTEVMVINGAIVRAGLETGIETPVNRMLLWLIEAIESCYPHQIGA